jgi:hypothetical protein
LRSWKPWAIALVPALVGGLFAIGPTIYEELTKPRAVLSFSRISGPTIGSPGSFRQISLIRIANSGRTPLTNVTLEVESPGGQIESSATSPAPGLKPTTQSNPTNMSIVLDRMLPTETLSTSVMTSSQSSQAVLNLNVRSNEVLGTEAAPTPETVKPEVVAAILAVAGATTASVVMLTTALVLRRRGFSLVFPQTLRPDIVTYVLALSDVACVSDLLPHESDISYRRASDMLLFSGTSGDAERRAKCVAGLRALLGATAHMQETSLDIIRSNLAALGAPITEEEFNQLRKRAANVGIDLLAARAVVSEIFQEA